MLLTDLRMKIASEGITSTLFKAISHSVSAHESSYG